MDMKTGVQHLLRCNPQVTMIEISRIVAKIFFVALAAVAGIVWNCETAQAHAVEIMSFGGDNLKMEKTYRDGDTIEFCVSKSTLATGLKMLKVFNHAGSSIAHIEVTDAAPGPVCASFLRQSLLYGFRFELFGRQSAMSHLPMSGMNVRYLGISPLEHMGFHWLTSD
ncbi:MAG: hypothetical protein HQK85_06785 [Nitrospinae bacterium]|nr:hypothetical protein [Nitrospinota bacterium]